MVLTRLLAKAIHHPESTDARSPTSHAMRSTERRQARERLAFGEAAVAPSAASPTAAALESLAQAAAVEMKWRSPSRGWPPPCKLPYMNATSRARIGGAETAATPAGHAISLAVDDTRAGDAAATLSERLGRLCANPEVRLLGAT